ncbi:hypothetical protein TNCV_2309561 [Trichonephila clavipes]|nr:hypothetical protein TNCV_2309561 [Trichonephila clavipes]
MPRIRRRNTDQQEQEVDRGKIDAEQECGLSFRDIVHQTNRRIPCQTNPGSECSILMAGTYLEAQGRQLIAYLDSRLYIWNDVVVPYLRGLNTLYQQDNAGPHVVDRVPTFLDTLFLPCLACSPNLSFIENILLSRSGV